MSLITGPDDTKNNSSKVNVGPAVQVTVGSAQVAIGGNLTNLGKIKVSERGSLSVQKDVLNSGDILINDPEKIK